MDNRHNETNKGHFIGRGEPLPFNKKASISAFLDNQVQRTPNAVALQSIEYGSSGNIYNKNDILELYL